MPGGLGLVTHPALANRVPALFQPSSAEELAAPVDFGA
jgi:hypothetical protein